MSAYHRVWIKGILTSRSALHVGSGEEKFTSLVTKKLADSDKEVEGHYSAVCLGLDDKPYLPASSLRGCLAEMARRLKIPTEFLFGLKIADSEKYKTGCLRVYDAALRAFPECTKEWSKPKNKLPHDTLLRTSVGINPLLGVADEHRLFNVEIVPAGAVFEVEFLLEDCEDLHLNQMLQLLNAWDGSAMSTLGGGSGVGRGRVVWALEKCSVLDNAGLNKWLASEDESLEQYDEKYYRLIKEFSDVPKNEEVALNSVQFILKPQGSFLLHDPAYTQKKVKKDASENSEFPDLTFSRTRTGQALIPATALRGWLRGRVRKILLTLQQQDVDEKIEKLFGSEQKRGILRFDDAVSTGIADGVAEPFLQSFNAVDRFTGGVAKSALYSVEAARCEELQGCISLMGKLPEWAKAVLLLVARDMLEGELSLGWGKSRGYGSFGVVLKIKNESINDVAALRARYPKTETEGWFTCLNRNLHN
ncbi:MAG: hypothetical protein RL368_1775 [Pseudomonadota bacterium]|jgi:CRISPR/Cas system CSM-associated protein Csm3 (group 7 of RAMP superfamily)